MTEHDNADEVTRLRAEVAEYRAKNFAPMSRINRAERVAENAVADKRAAEAEVTRLRAEVERLTAITKAQGQNVSWMSYHDATRRADALGNRALRAEAALTRVRAVADRWAAEPYPRTGDAGWNSGFDMALEQAEDDLRAALEPASPATRPYPDPADDDAPTVCIAHGCFVPCRRDGEHRLSTNPFWVKSVRDYQGSADQSLTWEPAWERTGTGAAPSEGHSEAQGDYVAGDLRRSLSCRNCGRRDDHGLCNPLDILLHGTRWSRS
jgi:hypothetical protein